MSIRPAGFLTLTPLLLLLLLLLGSATLSSPAWAQAQFKVVEADGSITYTDRPPPPGSARVTALRAGPLTPTGEGDALLPVELRQLVQRQPVTLFTTGDCVPCESGRKLLQQRGIPYAERRLGNDEDVLALERLTGARSVPALTIGPQPLRGFSETDWTAYLDAAGYPKTSRLPRSWKNPEPMAMSERTVGSGATSALPQASPPAAR